MRQLLRIFFVLGILFSGLSASAAPLSDEQVKTVLRQSNCFKCHSETENKAKDAPSFKEINADVRGRTNVEQRFIRRVTTRTKAEVKNKEVDHEPLKTKDEAEVRAVVQWIMSR
jgi:cytochrome c